MDKESRLNRIQFLKKKHKEVHAIVEALEAEKAPEQSIKHQKQIKLSIKDEITALETALAAEGVKVA